MHILIVSQYFWPESFPINDIAAGLIEQGHKVTVLTAIPNYPEGKFYNNYGIFKPFKERFNEIDIIRLPIISRGKSKGLRLALNYLSFVISGCLLAPFFCNASYDAIYVYGTSPITQALPAIVLKKLKKIPVILNVQDLWPESLSATGVVNEDSFVVKCVAKLVKYIYQQMTYITAQSESFIDSISKYNKQNENVEYMPNFCDSLYKPVEVVPDEIKAKFPTGFNVLFAGNIGVAQDFETILSVAEKLKASHTEVNFLIVGDGRQKTWLQEQVKQRELTNNVKLLGRYPAKQMPEFFAAADVLLVSLADKPIFALTIPTKIQSYLACGKPIIAAINGEGAKVIEQARAGFAVPAADVEGLYNVILEMYNLSSEQRQQLGRNGLHYSQENFNRDKILIKLIELFKKVSAK